MIITTILTSFGLLASATQSPPAPLVDRVGFPDGYQTTFVPLFAFDRPDTRQVRVVYGNHQAASTRKGEPYAYGSVLVMETHRARLDTQNVPVRDADGRFIRDGLVGIFVMRKERGYGVEYAANRTGEWEYVAYTPTGSFLTPPSESWSCANCHLSATAGQDWVFRTNLIHEGQASTGAMPDGVVQHYAFVPSAIRIRAGSYVTWLNDDQVEHRIAVQLPDRVLDGPIMAPGNSYRVRFNSTGDYVVACRIHPAMRARVTVDP
jgi:plastocyanin